MSDAEALMWNIERDPWLNPNGGMICVLDRPADMEQFRHRMRWAVAKIPRLRQRVVPGLGRLSPPLWASDPEFDFDYHVRHLRLPAPGSMRQLYELATRFYEDPFDRTRPLWVFVMIDGLEGDRSALFCKLHHSITDGKGDGAALRAVHGAGHRRPAAARGRHRRRHRRWRSPRRRPTTRPRAATSPRGFVDVAGRTIGHAWRRQAGIARRAVGEMALWSADPVRIKDVGEDAVESLRSLVSQVGVGGEVQGGVAAVDRTARVAATSRRCSSPSTTCEPPASVLGGTVNDVFVAGAVIGALALPRPARLPGRGAEHVLRGQHPHRRRPSAATPSHPPACRCRATGHDASRSASRVVRDRMAERREGVTGEGALNGLAGLANLLPTSVVTRVARSQAAHMDFATSNIRAAPFPLLHRGREDALQRLHGPGGGDGLQPHDVSYNGSLDIGAFIDPAAVEDPDDLRDCLETAYSELLEAGGVLRSRR